MEENDRLILSFLFTFSFENILTYMGIVVVVTFSFEMVAENIFSLRLVQTAEGSWFHFTDGTLPADFLIFLGQRSLRKKKNKLEKKTLSSACATHFLQISAIQFDFSYVQPSECQLNSDTNWNI
jgi:hypothetical protein